MERAAFDLLRALERSWWYRARARALARAIGKRRFASILDFGAGWGGMHDTLSAYAPDLYAFEPDADARAVCMTRGYQEVFASEAASLAHAYDAIVLLDVLEHIEEDVAFLERAKAALNPGGALIISVPAFQFLWSSHDVAHQHFRRYTIRLLRERLASAGYSVQYASYWNATLFLPAALMRLAGRTGESAFGMPKILDTLFYAALSVEAFLMRFLPLPFGTGIVALAERSPDGAKPALP